MASYLSNLAWATALLAGSSTAHMIMQSPVPFSIDKLDNSPLAQGDYPCKQKLGFTISKLNEIQTGVDTPLTFKGSAVHGGGSCQVAITLDKEPTANSKFKVIKSFQGGCPGVDGPVTNYTFNIPKDVPSGQVTFAWTWFSKLAGQNEMYMNCAPVKVTGGASTASSAGFDALPDLFVANIPESSCKTQLNHATEFPNPGDSQNQDNRGPAADRVSPTGSGCGASSGNSAGGSASSASSPAATPSASSSSAGGVFAPGASSTAGTASSAVASSAVVSTSTLTTMLTVTASQTPEVSSPAPAASTGTGSMSNGTACSPDGAVVCNGSTKFGLCNHGQVVWQDVAAGTTCVNGVISRRGPAARMLKHNRNPHVHSF